MQIDGDGVDCQRHDRAAAHRVLSRDAARRADRSEPGRRAQPSAGAARGPRRRLPRRRPHPHRGHRADPRRVRCRHVDRPAALPHRRNVRVAGRPGALRADLSRPAGRAVHRAHARQWLDGAG
ncbi:MAG: hypothetical protein E6J90_04725 [Deltaproteobacteria bacterium]|nr:MAG: hypothetical protein E6J90_04725 [Deltaproteobacteria bacterium]